MRSRLLWLVTLVPLLALSSRLSAQSVEPSSADSRQQDSINNATHEAAASAQASTQDSAQESSKRGSSSTTDTSEQVPAEKRKLRLRLGGFSVGAGYSHFTGPLYYPYAYPYGYAPFGFYPGDRVGTSVWYPWGSPYPYFAPGAFTYNNGRGEVRLTADPKEARVYIDSGYAGTADKLKNLWLDPGAYDLTISAAGHEDFHQRIYVLSGKSLKIEAKLNAGSVKEKP